MTAIQGGYICGGRGEPLPFLTTADKRRHGWCCMGDAEDGPAYCTCWEPIFDLGQAETLVLGPQETRRTRCHDCAYRADSPERARGDDVEGLSNFTCHQGIRRAVAYRHPDGRVRQMPTPDDYQPPFDRGGMPHKADGTPADICAGWAQTQGRRVRAIEARARALIEQA